jgi:hypothetical protein
MLKVLAWLGGIALAVAVLGLVGIDVSGWFEELWDALTGVGFGYLVAGWSLQTLQTTTTALGLVLHPARGLSGCAAAVPPGARRVRRRYRARTASFRPTSARS